jgi:hypothetical protein
MPVEETLTMSGPELIGDTAGKVWHYLKEYGRSSVTAVENGVDAPRALVDMGLGWLAREGKLQVAQEGRGVVVWLSE